MCFLWCVLHQEILPWTGKFVQWSLQYNINLFPVFSSPEINLTIKRQRSLNRAQLDTKSFWRPIVAFRSLQHLCLMLRRCSYHYYVSVHRTIFSISSTSFTISWIDDSIINELMSVNIFGAHDYSLFCWLTAKVLPAFQILTSVVLKKMIKKAIHSISKINVVLLYSCLLYCVSLIFSIWMRRRDKNWMLSFVSKVCYCDKRIYLHAL